MHRKAALPHQPNVTHMVVCIVIPARNPRYRKRFAVSVATCAANELMHKTRSRFHDDINEGSAAGLVDAAKCLNAATLNDALSQPAMRRVAVQAHVKAARWQTQASEENGKTVYAGSQARCVTFRHSCHQIAFAREGQRGREIYRRKPCSSVGPMPAGRASSMFRDLRILAAVPNVKWMCDLHPHH
jgi:hypothetical protein